jgi:hypothetical protein
MGTHCMHDERIRLPDKRLERWDLALSHGEGSDGTMAREAMGRAFSTCTYSQG